MKNMILCFQEEAEIKLLTQARRSYWKIRDRLKTEEEVETPLFKFRKVDKEEFRKGGPSFPKYVRVFSIIQKNTGKKYFVSMELYYGTPTWCLWKEEE